MSLPVRLQVGPGEATAGIGAGDDDRPRPPTTGVPTVDDVLNAFADVVEAG